MKNSTRPAVKRKENDTDYENTKPRYINTRIATIGELGELSTTVSPPQ